MPRLDINCDMGESFGIYRLGQDEEMLNVVTSVNIACGFHAGDAATMRRTVKAALEHGVAIGAHPGLPDLAGFGRRKMDVSPKDAYEMIVYQVGALRAFTRALGGSMQHVKAHGALYNMAATDDALARAVAEAVYDIDPNLVLFGLSGSKLVVAGQQVGLRVASEVFADRAYEIDGTLTPRNLSGAVIEDVNNAVSQVLRMINEGCVQSRQGTDVTIQADTVCVHGDGLNAVNFARELHKRLVREGVTVCSFSP